jgi:hypothetical protein
MKSSIVNLQSSIFNLKSSIPAVLLLCAAAACHPPRHGSLTGTASDDWARTYTLAGGGEVQVVGAAGSIEVVGTNQRAVEVRAERVARASTDAAARELLPRINIREDVSPDKIVLQTEGLSGLVIGVEVEVNYHISLPLSALTHLRTGGDVSVSNMAGRTVVAATNGAVVMKAIAGGAEVRAVNGNVDVELAAFGAEALDLRSTNGNVSLSIPADTNAYLLANFTNGKIDMGDLRYEPVGEQTRRRIRGRINAGGAPIELTTVNGNIQLHPRP